MAREIKFRAAIKSAYWDDYPPGTTLVSTNGLTLTQLMERMHDWELKVGGSLPTEDVAPDDEVAYLQYTGLKDKNGREIYEGDIGQVKPMRDNDNQGDTGQVYYYNGVWWLGNPEFGGYHLDTLVSYTERTSDRISTHLGNVVNIIGNIHENPELLQDAA